MSIDLYRPSVPPLVACLPYLNLVEANQFYSNFGPVHEQFKNRLSVHFEVDTSRIELFSSGTMALVAALEGLKHIFGVVHRPYCLLPSWTFVASAQAVIAAGLTPIFIDVDEYSMQLTAQLVEQVSEDILNKTAVVLVVSPFGAPLDLAGFESLCQRYGFEILCDCAAGFESTKANCFHTVISLHATKTFGIGEGGLLMSPNQNLLGYAKAYSNFGFFGSRQSKLHGVNAKLSEFQAAIGLAALDLWGSTKEDYYQKASYYLDAASGHSIKFQKGWGVNWISSTCVIRFISEDQKQVTQNKLIANQIQTREWWNQGCHLEPAFAAYQFLDLNGNTANLAKTTLGIPFYRDIPKESIEIVAQSLEIK